MKSSARGKGWLWWRQGGVGGPGWGSPCPSPTGGTHLALPCLPPPPWDSPLGFIFLITGFRGTPLSRNEEGILSWIPLKDFPRYPMWEGDRHFLPLVFDGDPRPFHGYMPYENEHPLSWSYSRL